MLLMREFTLEVDKTLLEGAGRREWLDLKEEFLLMLLEDLPEPSPFKMEDVVEGSFSLAVKGFAEGILVPSPPWMACLLSRLSSRRNMGQQSGRAFLQA